MAFFGKTSTKRVLSPWGGAVKKRLIDLNLKQDDLIDMLHVQGFQISKAVLSNMLYGTGVTNRGAEIERISEFLGIPYSSGTDDGKE